jgi:oxygen-independent coproporphyrinogen-3 oxidase
MTARTLTWNDSSPADQLTFAPGDVFAAGLRHHHIANTAYPIHHSTTMRPYRVPRHAVEEMAIAAWRDTKALGLYVHVPFCAARCKYCEYTVVDRCENETQDTYFDALLREIDLYRAALGTERKTLIGFDIGGGTPAFARPEHIRRVIESVRAAFRWQPGLAISIETTPIIADREPHKMRALKEMGIDRISMGVQTTHFKLARSLGREYEGLSMLHSAVRHIRDAGFDRFNIDLMYGFADQSPQVWQDTVTQTIALEPEYITLYQMRYKGTRIQDQAAQVTREQVHHLEQIAREHLLAAGYAGTPGKNTYSKIPGDPGTSDYLTARVVKGTPYLGLGLGAQTFSPYTLSYNLGAASKTLYTYLQAVDAGRLPLQDTYHLPRSAAMAKMISVSFYFGRIHLPSFEAKFGLSLEECFPAQLRFILDEGLMAYRGPYLQLTSRGVAHKNGVIALFYAGAVQEYLLNLDSDFVTPQPYAVRNTQHAVRLTSQEPAHVVHL